MGQQVGSGRTWGLQTPASCSHSGISPRFSRQTHRPEQIHQLAPRTAALSIALCWSNTPAAAAPAPQPDAKAKHTQQPRRVAPPTPLAFLRFCFAGVWHRTNSKSWRGWGMPADEAHRDSLLQQTSG